MLGMGTPEDSIKRFEMKRWPSIPTNRFCVTDCSTCIGRLEKKRRPWIKLIELLDRYHDSYEKARFAELFFVMGKHENGYQWLEEGNRGQRIDRAKIRLLKARELKMMHSAAPFS